MWAEGGRKEAAVARVQYTAAVVQFKYYVPKIFKKI